MTMLQVASVKETKQAFDRKFFGKIASPYLSPYVHRRGDLDAEYGLRRIGNRFLWVIPM